MSGLHLRSAWEMVREAAADWVEDKAAQQGAALAFYSILSLAPLLVISLAVAASVFGEQAARREIVGQLQGMVGEEGGQAAESMLESAQQPEQGTPSVQVAERAGVLLDDGGGGPDRHRVHVIEDSREWCLVTVLLDEGVHAQNGRTQFLVFACPRPRREGQPPILRVELRRGDVGRRHENTPEQNRDDSVRSANASHADLPDGRIARPYIASRLVETVPDRS